MEFKSTYDFSGREAMYQAKSKKKVIVKAKQNFSQPYY